MLNNTSIKCHVQLIFLLCSTVTVHQAATAHEQQHNPTFMKLSQVCRRMRSCSSQVLYVLYVARETIHPWGTMEPSLFSQGALLRCWTTNELLHFFYCQTNEKVKCRIWYGESVSFLCENQQTEVNTQEFLVPPCWNTTTDGELRSEQRPII